MGMNTPEGRQAYIDSQESDMEKTKTGHDFSTPEGKQRYINSQKSDLENTESGFDLSAPEGRQKQINNQESDLEKAEKEALVGRATVELSSLEKNEENPIVDSRELEYSKDSELENLTSEVEKARKAYAKKDYEITNVFSTYKVLTGRLHVDAEIIKEKQYYYDQYKLALNNLLNCRVEKLKEKNLSPDQLKKEMEDLAKYYNQDEKTNLYEAHTNARAEVWEQKFGKDAGWLAKTSGKFIKYTNEKINDYRKLNWKKKMAFGLVAGLAGAGFLVVGQRILGGVAAGVGVTAGLEGRYRKKEGQKREKEQKEILENIENVESPEEKFEALMDRLQEEINDFNRDLMNEKSEALMRKIMGSAIGIFLSSGVMSQLMHLGMDKTGLNDVFKTAKDFYFGKAPEVSIAHSGGNLTPENEISGSQDSHAGTNPENISKTGIENSNIKESLEFAMSKTEIPVESGSNIELTIPKDSSFEGVLIKHLESTGVSHKEAGGMAHRMYLDFLKAHPDPTGHDYNIVHPNAHLELSPDGKSIASFHDSPKAEWPKIPETKINIEEAVGVDSVPVSENINAPEVEKIMTDAGIGNEKTIEATAFATAAMAGGLGAKNVLKFPDAEKRALKRMAKKYDINESASSEEQISNFVDKMTKEISIGKFENWKKIKDRKILELTKKDKTIDLSLAKNIKKTEKYFVSLLGEEARFRDNETVKQWIARVIKDSLEKNNSDKKAV